QPGGADRGGPLVVLLHGAVERPRQGRHAAADDRDQGRGHLPAGPGHHRHRDLGAGPGAGHLRRGVPEGGRDREGELPGEQGPRGHHDHPQRRADRLIACGRAGGRPARPASIVLPSRRPSPILSPPSVHEPWDRGVRTAVDGRGRWGLMREVWPGEPYPLGASWDGVGTNFSLFSEVAERVELCLFDDDGTETRVELTEVDAFVWHGYLPG